MEIKIRTHDEFQRDHVTIEIIGTHDEAQAFRERMDRVGDAGTIEGLRDRVSDLEQGRAADHEEIVELRRQRDAAQQAREIETKRAEEMVEKVQLRDTVICAETKRADRAQAREKGLAGRVASLESDLARYRRAHVCTDRCDGDAHVAFEGNQLVKELEQELANEREQGGRIESELNRKIRDLQAELEQRFTVEQVADAKDGARADALAPVTRAVHGALIDKALARIWETQDGRTLAEAVREVRRLINVHE